MLLLWAPNPSNPPGMTPLSGERDAVLLRPPPDFISQHESTRSDRSDAPLSDVVDSRFVSLLWLSSYVV